LKFKNGGREGGRKWERYLNKETREGNASYTKRAVSTKAARMEHRGFKSKRTYRSEAGRTKQKRAAAFHRVTKCREQ
jgi:hypothetical protein